jgi:hypothetical protein
MADSIVFSSLRLLTLELFVLKNEIQQLRVPTHVEISTESQLRYT